MKKQAVAVVSGISPRGLDIRAAAEYLGCAVWAMRQLVWARRIPFLKIGHRYIFDRSDLDSFIESEKSSVGVA